MAPRRRRRHHLLLSSALFFLILSSATSTTTPPPTTTSTPGKLSFREDLGHDGTSSGSSLYKMGRAVAQWVARRRLMGPGSAPPTCRGKCGSCTPCKPVHVPIHPGFSAPLEYYPEAWRCKCGNKLYMP